MTSPLTTEEILLRVGCAALAGLFIGIEREIHGRPAGLRTIVLVATSAAIAMIVSEYYYYASYAPEAAGSGAGWRPDPARLSAGILTGMGFIGGGAIIRLGSLVVGVTTASMLWFATVLGLCFGAGLYEVGAIGSAVVIAVALILPLISKILPVRHYAELVVKTTGDTSTEQDQMIEALKQSGLKVESLNQKQDLSNDSGTLRFLLRFRERRNKSISTTAVNAIKNFQGVESVSFQRS